jgi:hypothetical protein
MTAVAANHPRGRRVVRVLGAVVTAIVWLVGTFFVCALVALSHFDTRPSPVEEVATVVVLVCAVVGAVGIGLSLRWRRVGVWTLAAAATIAVIGLIVAAIAAPG